MLEFFERFDEEKYGTDGGPLHDPCVIAYLLKPELFKGRNCNVTVETASELTMGMTVIDWWGVTKRPKNAMVMRDIDHDGVLRAAGGEAGAALGALPSPLAGKVAGRRMRGGAASRAGTPQSSARATAFPQGEKEGAYFASKTPATGRRRPGSCR